MSVLGVAEATARSWDVVVIGGGPAGSVAARQLASSGLETLVVEKSRMPRWKVCGGCLNALGVQTLERIGLGHVLSAGFTPRVRRVRMCCGRASFSAELNAMRAVSREVLDSSLLREAENAGAALLQGSRAEVRDGVAFVDQDQAIRARAIVDATGLRSGAAGAGPIGAGVTVDGRGASGHELTMAVGNGGYLGRVLLGDSRVNWAIAVDPEASRRAGGIGGAARSIWRSCGMDPDEVPDTGWRGTGRLRQRRMAQSGSLFRTGDALGYVEPITGEGMSWAIAQGAACAPCVNAFVRGVRGDNWSAVSRRLMRGRAWRCRAVSELMRSPALLSLGLRSAGWIRPLGEGTVRRLIENRAVPA